MLNILSGHIILSYKNLIRSLRKSNPLYNQIKCNSNYVRKKLKTKLIRNIHNNNTGTKDFQDYL